jgi:nucleoside-diphosphate-sugar epimerase
MPSTPRGSATELGWRPSVTLDQGLERTVDWYLATRLVAPAPVPAGRGRAAGEDGMILVFGQTGQVARHLAADPRVTALGRAAADLSDPDACAEAIWKHRPRAVINAAAWTAVDAAEEAELKARTVNAVSPGYMAEAAAELEIPFVQISTDYVFDGSGDRPWQPEDATARWGPMAAPRWPASAP